MKYSPVARIKLGGLFLAAIALLTGLSFSSVEAQQGSGQALEIAPPVLNLSGDPGETVRSEIILRDVSDSPLIVTNQINDFVADGEDGTPRILLDTTEESPFSMRSWFDPISELTLQPRTLTRLPVVVNIPANASPGGYFSVVRFTGTAPDVSGNGVGLSASIGALVFVNVNGDAKEEVSVEEFYTSIGDKRTNLFQAAPVDFNVRLNNTGNTYEQPTGQILVTDMFGNTVATVNVNLPPRNVLPSSIRKFEAPLDSSVIGNKILFGLYTADLTVTYGSNDQQVTQRVTFWVIPYTLIAIIVGVLIIGFFVFRTMIRRYNQHIIKQASKQKRK